MRNDLQPALNHLFKIWPSLEELQSQIAFLAEVPAKNSNYSEFSPQFSQELINIVQRIGIEKPYSHQRNAWDVILNKKNLIITSGTSSGKSLCYQMPVWNDMLLREDFSALFLFPTKALGHDQHIVFSQTLKEINHYLPTQEQRFADVLDGDTSYSARSKIRERADILFTNPDMLHLGILPRHPSWSGWLRHLKYIVVDEIHTYRGVFGSHIANVFRRLNRICQFYGANPQFILTSATIANPVELAERLINQRVEWIQDDGSPKGKKFFMIYNPPIVDDRLGIREGAGSSALRLAEAVNRESSQTLVFAKSRKGVERLLLQSKNIEGKAEGYRSGYLDSSRRRIEEGLRSQSIPLVISTNALESGVDIGGMDVVIIVGYPGTITSIKQQSGRGGRRNQDSLSILVASGSPIDQYLVNHPEFFLERSPEAGLIDPDSPLILLQHLNCALHELPIFEGDSFGDVNKDLMQKYLGVLVSSKLAIERKQHYYWIGKDYPAANISLRTVDSYPFEMRLVEESKTHLVGLLDSPSAPWMAHPGAIYLQEGEFYKVERNDYAHHIILLRKTDSNLYTVPLTEMKINIEKDYDKNIQPNFQTGYSEITVTSQVTGYRVLDWSSQQLISEHLLEMQPEILRTMAYSLSLMPNMVNSIRSAGLWLNDGNQYGKDWKRITNAVRKRDSHTCQFCGKKETIETFHVHHRIPKRQFSNEEQANQMENLILLCPSCHRRAELVVKMRSGLSGLGYVLYQLAPLLSMCDLKDIGFYLDHVGESFSGNPTLLFFDIAPGGIGIAHNLFKRHTDLIDIAYDQVRQCRCLDGCPACIGPAGELGAGGKPETMTILDSLVKNV